MSNSKSNSSNVFASLWAVLNTPIRKKAEVTLTEADLLKEQINRLKEENDKCLAEEKENDAKVLDLGLKAHQETKLAIELTEKLDELAEVFVNNSEDLVASRKELKAAEEKYNAQKAENETLMRKTRLSALEKVALANSARLANMTIAEYQAFKASEAKADVKVEAKVEVPLSKIKVASLDDAKAAQAVLAKGENLIVDISELNPQLGAKLIIRLSKENNKHNVYSNEVNVFCFEI